MNKRERNDLIISWLTLSAAFALVLSDGLLNILAFPIALPIAAIGVGSGFIFHELAHRQVARHFGAHAEFRAWKTGLLFAIIIPIVTFGRLLFAAPGAVYIYGGNIGRRENGLISTAGPLTNILVAFAFLSLIALFRPIELLTYIIIWAARINLILAWFNLIPVFILDGAKVFAWNKTVWAILFAISSIGMFFFPLLLSLIGAI